MLSNVSVYHTRDSYSFLIKPPQTFKERLPDIMDQAQHFGALGVGAGGSGGGQAGEGFREGLDGTERESESPFPLLACASHEVPLPVFSLAQETARLTKQWYESSDRAKR